MNIAMAAFGVPATPVIAELRTKQQDAKTVSKILFVWN